MKLVKCVAVGSVLSLAIATFSSVSAEQKRPYRNGSVWDLTFIRVKPGMDTAYLTYVAGMWKDEQIAARKAGLTLSYKILTTESHDATDWNILLMTEFKNLAAKEANAERLSAVWASIAGDDQKQIQGYRERSEMREFVGTRVAREILVEGQP